MIKVTVELVSAFGANRDQTLGVMYVINDGSGTGSTGNYDVHVCRKGSYPSGRNAPSGKPTRSGRVEDYPRTSYNVWRLIARALLSAFPEEST